MKNTFSEIYDKNIVHTSFLDKRTVMKCMEDSYFLGVNEVLNWMSEMNHLSDNVDYLIQEYKNQHNE